MIGVLLANWKYAVMGVLLLVIAILGLYVKTLKAEISVVESEKMVLNSRLMISNDSVTRLQSSIDEQNVAIQKFKDAAAEREVANRTAIAKAKSEAASARRRADDLMSRVIPQNTTACGAANQLFNEEIKNAK